MKLFEAFCLVHGGGVKVQKKRRKRKNNKGRNKKHKSEETTELPAGKNDLEEKESAWDAVTSQLSSVLQGHIDLPTDVVPFDPLAEHGFDEKLILPFLFLELYYSNNFL